jgi:Domain of unknown function (DUF4129)
VESRGRSLLVAIWVALLLVVVALASRPEAGQPGPDIGGEPARVVVDTFFYLFLLAALAALLIAVWALWPHPEVDIPALERRRWPVLLALLASLTVVGLVWWRARWGPLPILPFAQQGGATGGTVAGSPRRPTTSHGTDWPALLITATALAGIGAFLWRGFRARPRAARVRRPAGGALDKVVEQAIDDVLSEEDPRRAVIAAWARMEMVLAASGLPRHAAEAPFEYAARAFAELGLPAAGLEGFAGLFEWARFSLNEVTASMREEAVTRLVALREGIRIAA